MRHELSWQYVHSLYLPISSQLHAVRRTTRNPLFIQGRHAQVPPDGSTALSRLDSLRGVPVEHGVRPEIRWFVTSSNAEQAGARRCILGSLVQIEEGSVFLEDAYAVNYLSIMRIAVMH